MSRNIVGNIGKMLKLIESPVYICLHVLYTCLGQLKWAVFPVFFIDHFLELIINGAPNSEIGVVLGSYILILCGIGVFSIWFDDYYKPVRLPRIQESFRKKLFVCSANCDLENFDNSDFYNEYVFTMTKADETANSVITELSGFVGNILITVCIAGFFIQIDFCIAVAVFISVMITAGLFSRIIKINYDKDVTMTPHTKRTEYYKIVFYLKDYSKELRMTDIGSLLMKQFDKNEKAICSIHREYGKKLRFYHTMNGLTISTLLDIGLRILLTYELMVAHTITISEYTASTFAIWSLFPSLNGLIANFHNLSENSLRIDKIFRFLDKKATVYVKGNRAVKFSDKQDVIACRNLSFHYPGKNEPAIEGLNLELRKGETLAVVGEKGSGKSTLVKLLLGLYMPNDGEILMNGQSLSETDIVAYRKMFSAVFQDFAFFPASVAGNIMLDDRWDEEELQMALAGSLYAQDEFLKGISTDMVLTKEFDDEGIVLSGGQAQKLAIARAFRRPPFVIMDEPSSELDVISETGLNELLLKNEAGKGIMIIAHRLTTTKKADRIIVLSKGRKIEEGSHEELMRRRGHYYNMFMAQAKQYCYADI
ncbi:MAG: ABC transporter ATP-binding protein/permease [Lachnospiraceae bacterium]|nr:ABC transporter ATP-binding protein/permease [Lachnospiraceae bacterium]